MNEYREDISNLVLLVMENHPLQGNSRLCNKLLSFLSGLKGRFSSSQSQARRLYSRIIEETSNTYKDLTSKVNLDEVEKQIDEIGKKWLKVLAGGLKQSSVSGIPKWYNPSEPFVDQTFHLHLLFKIDEMSDWELLIEKESMKPNHEREMQCPSDSVIDHIRKYFGVEYILCIVEFIYCLLTLFNQTNIRRPAHQGIH